MAASRFAYLSDSRWWAAAASALPVWFAAACLWRPTSFAAPVVPWLTNVALYPVLEEIVFRGGVLAYLLGWAAMRRGWFGISAANLIAASVFALAHLAAHPPLWAAAVWIPGLVFGWCYERWGLGSAVALHIWYNAGYFTLYPPAA